MAQTRLLVVEDDAVSAAFLVEALSALPARVQLAGSIAEALRCVEDAEHDLWLVDAHLPDGDGLDCLRALRSAGMRECRGRQDAGSGRAGRQVPALAITAGAPREELDALCAGGFLEVLMKPVGIALLLGTVRRLLGGDDTRTHALPETGGKLPCWDEPRALAALGGNRASLLALRRLFLQELPGQRRQLAQSQAAADAAGVSALVHKLRASCGFVGAARMARAVEALARSPLDAQALQGFEFAAEDAIAASEAQP